MELSQYIQEFSTHIGCAIDAITKAAKVYATALDTYGKSAHDAFTKAYPHVTENTWSKFRAVGNGDANPNVLLFSDKFAARIMRMPVDRQNEVLNGESFQVFNPTTREVEKVGYSELRPRHERILFDENTSSMRTIQGQVEYADLMAAARKKSELPYEVKTGRLEVYKACSISREEVSRINEELGE